MFAGDLVIRAAEIGDLPDLLALKLNPTDPFMDRAHAKERFEAILALPRLRTSVDPGAIEAAWKAGCYKVMLLTGSEDPTTLRFYENCGFTQDKTGYQIRR